MPSPAERLPYPEAPRRTSAPVVDSHIDDTGPERGSGSGRQILEMALHVVAFALLAWTLWRILSPAPVTGARVVAEADLPAALREWSTTDSVTSVHVRFTGAPTGVAREWLHAFPKTGTHVSWDRVTGGSLPATAADVEPVADPQGMIRTSVAGPVGSKIVLGDALGPIDSAIAPHGIVTFRMKPPFVSPTATVDNTIARPAPPDSIVLRRALVVGSATWEGKFIAEALQDEGWGVDVHFAVAPKNDVVTAKLPAIDTAHYALVVATDTALSGTEGAIRKFVASGGGLILSPDAVLGLQSLAAGAVGQLIRPSPALSDSFPKEGLALEPITQLVAGAVPLEHRGETMVTVAARRVENGRVVQIAYPESWHWRMAAGDSGKMGHRQWWAGLAAAVAYAPALSRATTTIADPAPLSAMVDRMGPPTLVPPQAAPAHVMLLPVWVFAVVILGLLVEWASRRLRGEK